METILNNIKLVNGITSDESDDLINFYINQAVSVIENYTGITILETTIEKRLHGNGQDEFILPKYPVIEMLEFKYNAGTINEPTWEAASDTSYFLNKDNGIISLTSGVPRGISNIKVKYTAGFETIPKDISSVIFNYANDKFTKNQIGNHVKSESVDGASVTYNTSNDSLQAPDYNILNKYKSYV